MALFYFYEKLDHYDLVKCRHNVEFLQGNPKQRKIIIQQFNHILFWFHFDFQNVLHEKSVENPAKTREGYLALFETSSGFRENYDWSPPNSLRDRKPNRAIMSTALFGPYCAMVPTTCSSMNIGETQSILQRQKINETLSQQVRPWDAGGTYYETKNEVSLIWGKIIYIFYIDFQTRNSYSEFRICLFKKLRANLTISLFT